MQADATGRMPAAGHRPPDVPAGGTPPPSGNPPPLRAVELAATAAGSEPQGLPAGHRRSRRRPASWSAAASGTRSATRVVVVLGPARRRPSTGGSSSKGTIKVGAAVPVTGPYAGDGQQMYRGQQLAVEEINAAGGVAGYQLELVKVDTQAQEPDVMKTVVQNLVSQNVAAMFMPFCSYTSVEFPILADIEDADVPRQHLARQHRLGRRRKAPPTSSRAIPASSPTARASSR